MKSCPTCNRTFEDSFSFCLVDGAILSAPYDAQATQSIPEIRITNPPRTEVLHSNVSPNYASVPPTIMSPLLEPTRAYVSPELTPPQSKALLSDDPSAHSANVFRRVVLGFGAGVVFAYILSTFTRHPGDAIILGMFFGLVGAVVGKFSPALVKLIKTRKRD